MKVLWFTNKLMPAVAERLGTPSGHGGGWMEMLMEGLARHPDRRLAVAAESAVDFAPFTADGVSYYRLGSVESGSSHQRVLGRWRTSLRPEMDVSDCLGVIDDFQPDVVHVHGTEGRFGLSCGQTKTPSVISLQGIINPYRLLRVGGMDIDYWRSVDASMFLRGVGMAHDVSRWRGQARREREIVAGCRNFIGRTRWDEDVISSLNPKARYFHCDELLRPAFWDLEWSLEDATAFRLYATVGHYAIKGVSTLLRAIKILSDSCAWPLDVRLGGSLGLEGKRAARRTIRRLDLGGIVTLLGPLSAPQIAQELVDARVFPYPANADNSPNALCEALLVGTPVVASAAGGIPSLARDGVEALLCQPGDPFALAGALRRLLTDNDLAERLSRTARATAQRRHDPERVVRDLLSVYDAVSVQATGDTSPSTGQ